ncbi:MAG: LysR family transcriptional regulator [Lachnospiraceae bacterium]|nr:LysR family transcriptional regulator [Lachnospiraceae bacterium]
METKDLSILMKAIELGSLAKASTELGYSPSAASHVLERLEEQLGISLLERSHSGVTPTRECQTLLPYVKTILEQQSVLKEVAERLGSKESARLNVGTISSVAVNWLPEIIDPFLEKFPWTEVITFEGSYLEIEHWLQEGTVDCAFVSAGTQGTFSFLPLRSDPFHVVFPKGHPLSQKETVHPLELRGYDLIIQEDGLKYDAPAFFRVIPKDYPHVLSVHLRDLSVLSMVRQGRGVAILPEMLLRNAGAQGIDSRPLSTGEKRTICLAYTNANGAARSPVLQRFIDHVSAWATQS